MSLARGTRGSLEGAGHMKGTKALGAVIGTLSWVPYLPFARTATVGASLVGGAYLYSSDLWATYVDLRKRGLRGKYQQWTLALVRHARTARLAGCRSGILI